MGWKSPALTPVLWLCVAASAAEAQPYARYSDFLSLSHPELASLQAKISYIGPSDYLIPGLAFTSTESRIEFSAFVPYGRGGVADTCRVPVGLLQAMIDSVAQLPGVVDGGVDSLGYVSFALVKTAGGMKGFESIVGQEHGRPLLRKIEEAFASDSTAVRKVRECACWMSLAYDDPPEEVTSKVKIDASEFRRIEGTNIYTATVRVTNISASTLPAPLTLLPRFVDEHGYDASVDLLGENGYVCMIRSAGKYLDLHLGAGGLASGASVEILLRITHGEGKSIRMSPAVYAGPGTR